MPQLPTFTVTDAQASRITAAFGNVETYKAWLKQSIIDYVVAYEERVEYETWKEQRQAKNDAIRTELNI